MNGPKQSRTDVKPDDDRRRPQCRPLPVGLPRGDPGACYVALENRPTRPTERLVVPNSLQRRVFGGFGITELELFADRDESPRKPALIALDRRGLVCHRIRPQADPGEAVPEQPDVAAPGSQTQPHL